MLLASVGEPEAAVQLLTPIHAALADAAGSSDWQRADALLSDLRKDRIREGSTSAGGD
jgi:hypothetical protein